MWAEISAHMFFSQAGSIFLMAYLLGFDIIEFIKIIYNLFAKIGDVKGLTRRIANHSLSS